MTKPCPHLITGTRRHPNTTTNTNRYRQVGCLRNFADCTRPDYANITGNLVTALANPTEHHWNSLKGVMSYLKQTILLVISFPAWKLQPPQLYWRNILRMQVFHRTPRIESPHPGWSWLTIRRQSHCIPESKHLLHFLQRKRNIFKSPQRCKQLKQCTGWWFSQQFVQMQKTPSKPTTKQQSTLSQSRIVQIKENLYISGTITYVNN